MLGLQGSNSSPKVYRCVACLATFNGLASLLVHQATHASSLPKAPAAAPSDFSLRQTRFVSMDSPSEHPNPQLDCSSPSFYICDCGEEFQDFSLMLEHKRSHQPQPQLLQPLDNNSNSVLSSGTGCDGVFPSQHASFMPTVSQPGLVLSCPSTSRFPAVELPTLSDRQADRSLGDGVAMVTSPQGQCTPSPDENQLENMSASAEQMAEAAEDMRFQDNAKSIPGSNKDDSLPRNQSVMKLLASAYMKRFQKPLAQNQNDNTVTPKKEVDPVDITPALKNEAAPINDLSIAQLRRLLAKPGIKTKAPSISRILECSKKKVVSLTKTFSPVVVLETRQKLMAPGSNGTFRYQCGRCRRGFQNLDKLTEHHFLHKKERIKCCRRCKQLIIGRLPLPDSHVCPQLRKSTQTSALRKKTTLGQKLVPFHSLSNSKKVFFCPLCKHSYARRWNLKMHRCQGPRSTPSPQASPSIQPAPELRSNSAASTDAVVTAGSQVNKSVAVGTDITSKVKVEVTSQQSTVSQSAWTPAKSFLPYYSKSAMMEEHTDVSLSGILVQQGEESNSWDAAGDTGDSDEGEWTMPLDDEIEMVSAQREAGNDTGVKSSVPQTMPYFIRDGAKRYPCSRCQKTYSRPSTLRRHLRLCGLRQRGPSGPARALLTTNNKPLFACLVCGKTFNRKDNMMVHRRKCQMQRTMTDGAQVDTGAVQHSMSSNGAESQPDGDDGSNWGIMSLPSVLPRRVTCECGVGFTSPRLLLEHLQKHAQESYTCPTCGETVSSWADYEVHLQIHMLPHHQLLKGLPHRSQPLLLRFQQQPPQQQQHQQWQQQQWQQQQQQQRQQQQQQQRQQQQQQQRQQQQQQQQQSSPSVHQSPQRQTRAGLVPNPAKKQPKILCSRCGNAFSTRHSLRRHLSWNRCKGARATNPANPPKTYHCSHCNSDFPNTISLMFHQRSGACKPAIKPVRCPVCLRWFGTLDGLQKHLLTHKQSNSESHRCDICQGTYPNLKSLKSHRRRIHRIMAGDVNEQLTS